MSVPSVSVIISVFEQLQYTKRCLAQLEETLAGKLDYEVLVIDDASKDGTVEFLKGLGERYRVFFNDENQGFAKNNNKAAREARGEFLCFLNNDVFVQGDWLTPMLRVFEEKEKVGMVGNVQKLAGSRRYDHMGIVFSPEGLPKHYGEGFLHHPFKDEVRKWNAVTAACCVANRRNFLAHGGFDEVFLNGCEDIDLCIRMGQEGFCHYVAHGSVVLHVKCASAGRLARNKENESKFLERWEETISNRYFPQDRSKYAYWYVLRSLIHPRRMKIHLFLESLSILTCSSFKFSKR
jgi:GT2 family glycosyltransferase